MTPTDTLYGSQWHFSLLDNTAELLIQRIWNEFDGTGIHVGVYDDGIQISHFDLNDNYDATRHIVINGNTLSGNVTIDDDTHGTSVAGLIAAEANGTNTVGVAFGADLTGINIFDANSVIYINSANATVINNFYNALSQGTNFDVVNHSWGSEPSFAADQNLNDPLSFSSQVVAAYAYIAINGRGGLGTSAVQSAGNETTEANGDGINASRYTITVGAIHNDGYASSYSNYGANLLVSAAGGDFANIRGGLGTWSTDRTGHNGYNLRSNPNGSFDYTDDFGGTSSAAPITSGVIALMLDANPNLGWRDVQNILAASADHTGSAINGAAANLENNTWFINDATNWNGGGMHFSEDYGYGRVNAYAAVRMAEVWTLFNVAQTSANEQSLNPAAFNYNAAISDNSTSNFQFTISGNLTIEHVDLTISFTHSFFTDLRIYLVSATGTEVQLADGTTGDSSTSDGILTWTFGIDALRGELAAGTWTLRIVDAVNADSGTLFSVDFDAYGTTPTANDTYHYTDEFLAMRVLEPARTILTDTDGGTDWIDAAAMTGNLVLNLRAGASSTVNGSSFISVGATSNIENAVGGDGNDTINGSDFANILYGMRGNDILNGGTGEDTSFGGAGDDRFVISFGDFADNAYGDAGTDTLDLTLASNAIVLGSYYWVVNLSLHEYLLFPNETGPEGVSDIFDVENVIGAELYGDVITGDELANVLSGLSGGDTLNGAGGADTLNGGTDNDTLNGGAGADILNGGDDNDTASYANNSAGVTVLLKSNQTNEGGGVFDTLSSIENVIGSNFDDTIEGNSVANALYGLGGIDTAYYYSSVAGVTVNLNTLAAGIGGDAAGDTFTSIENVIGSNTGGDTLTGGNENNFFNGNGGADTLTGAGGGDSLFGGDGDDLIRPGAGFDYVVGGNNIDTVDYSSSAVGVGVHLFFNGGFAGDAIGDGINDIENVIGSLTAADTIYGNNLANNLQGLGGDDIIHGSLGSDVMDGGAGAADTAYYFLSAGPITVNLSSILTPGIGGDAAGDTYLGIENVIGTQFGGDTLTGNNDSNFINGYGGADTINGGLGNDSLAGGVDSDTFRFTDVNFGFDYIGDWEDGSDRISLASNVATSMAQLTLTLIDADTWFVTIGAAGITVNSASAFTLEAGDFLFV